MSYRPTTLADRFVVSLVAVGLVFFALWHLTGGGQ